MRNKAFLLMFCWMSLGYGGYAQSYEHLEDRFAKAVLTADDSAAFREQGLQKVRSLFYMADLYQRNTNNTSNQAYITHSLEDIFYVEEGDTLNLKPMLKALEEIQYTSKRSGLKLKLTSSSTCLARVETLNTKPRLQYDLILKRTAKLFGDQKQMLWQVFLSVPLIEEE